MYAKLENRKNILDWDKSNDTVSVITAAINYKISIKEIVILS